MKPEHGKVITTESYYDGNLSHTKQEFEVSVFSSHDMLLKDILEGLAILTTGQTTKLCLDVSVDNKGKYRIVRRWIV